MLTKLALQKLRKGILNTEEGESLHHTGRGKHELMRGIDEKDELEKPNLV